MTAVINPFIYSWQNRDLNAAYRKMLGLQNKVGVTTSLDNTASNVNTATSAAH